MAGAGEKPRRLCSEKRRLRQQLLGCAVDEDTSFAEQNDAIGKRSGAGSCSTT